MSTCVTGRDVRCVSTMWRVWGIITLSHPHIHTSTHPHIHTSYRHTPTRKDQQTITQPRQLVWYVHYASACQHNQPASQPASPMSLIVPSADADTLGLTSTSTPEEIYAKVTTVTELRRLANVFEAALNVERQHEEREEDGRQQRGDAATKNSLAIPRHSTCQRLYESVTGFKSRNKHKRHEKGEQAGKLLYPSLQSAFSEHRRRRLGGGSEIVNDVDEPQHTGSASGVHLPPPTSSSTSATAIPTVASSSAVSASSSWSSSSSLQAPPASPRQLAPRRPGRDSFTSASTITFSSSATFADALFLQMTRAVNSTQAHVSAVEQEVRSLQTQLLTMQSLLAQLRPMWELHTAGVLDGSTQPMPQPASSSSPVAADHSMDAEPSSAFTLHASSVPTHQQGELAAPCEGGEMWQISNTHSAGRPAARAVTEGQAEAAAPQQADGVDGTSTARRSQSSGGDEGDSSRRRQGSAGDGSTARNDDSLPDEEVDYEEGELGGLSPLPGRDEAVSSKSGADEQSSHEVSHLPSSGHEQHLPAGVGSPHTLQENVDGRSRRRSPLPRDRIDSEGESDREQQTARPASSSSPHSAVAAADSRWFQDDIAGQASPTQSKRGRCASDAESDDEERQYRRVRRRVPSSSPRRESSPTAADPRRRTIYVHSKHHLEEGGLKHIFSTAERVVMHVDVPPARPGKGHFAFVHFAREADADSVLRSTSGGWFEGLRVKRYDPPCKPRSTFVRRR